MNTSIRSNEPYLAILLYSTIGLYLWIIWPGLNGIFLFDDFPNLQNLNQIDGQLSWSRVGDYLASYGGSPGRPIAALSFLINDYAWPSNPFSFKYTNVLIHILNGVLLFGLLRQLAKASPALPQNIFWPMLAMTAWLFHPLQLSAQMLVVQRMTLLSALFSIAGLWTYITLLQRTKTIWMAFLAMATLGIATVLAFLCKENGALLPLFAWVLNVTLLRNLLEQKMVSTQRFIFWGCMLPSVAVLITILLIGLNSDDYALREFNLANRLYTQSHVLLDYARTIFIPHISGSGIYHDDYQVYQSFTSPISTIFSSLAILGGFVLGISYRRRWPLLSFSVLWFMAGHAMESTTIALELYFEHRNYLPLLGPVIYLTAAPFSIAQHMRKITGLFLGIWLLMISTITALQAPVWGNHALMATLWAEEKPNSLRATQELAKYYYDNHQAQRAVDILMSAYNRGINNADLPMGALLAKCWIPAISINGDILIITENALIKSPHSNSILEALKRLREASSQKICPDLLNESSWWKISDKMLENPKLNSNSADFIRIERARARIDSKDLQGAMIELEAAYAFKPSTQLAYKTAELLVSAGLYEEAIVWLQKGLSVKNPLFDELVSSDKEKSLALLHDLEDIRKLNSNK